MVNTATSRLLREISMNLGIDLCSRDFIFGNDETFRQLRNSLIFRPPAPPVSLLRLILREAMPPSKFAEVFDDAFDLGSPTPIPKEQRSLLALAEKVRAERKVEDHPDTRGKEFERLSKSLRELVGYGIRDYSDKQNTLRVVYLLERLARDSSSHATGRKVRLFSLLRIPEKNGASFESRTDHPTFHSADFCWTAAELRNYLGIEIDICTLKNVDAFYEAMPDWLNSAFSSLLDISLKQSSDDKRTEFLRAAVHRISMIEPEARPPEGGERRLDLDLYVHTHRWEFLNFSRAFVHALDFARPTSTVMRISSALDEASASIIGYASPKAGYHTKAINLQQVPSVLRAKKDLISKLVERAIGKWSREIDEERVARAAHELLRRIIAFSRGLDAVDDARVCTAEMLAAVIAVTDEHRSPTKFLTRAYGTGTISRSLSSTLEKPMLNGTNRPVEVPEGLSQVWQLRYEWMRAGILGGLERNQLKLDLRRTLLEKMSQCANALDFPVAERRLENLARVVGDCAATEEGARFSTRTGVRGRL